MDPSYELKYHKFENNYFWFKARRDIIFKLLQTTDRNEKILDLGCSSGELIEFLNTKYFNNIYGLDLSKKAINLCENKGLKNVFVMDGANPQFNNEKFDIIVASDVLEHIKNDRSGLEEWYKLLKPNGKLIVFVPAFNFLWNYSDELNHHYRRYSKITLIRMLKDTNFRVDRISYWNFSLFFPAVVIKLYQRLFANYLTLEGDDFYELNPLINKVLTGLLKIENYFLKLFNFPFGLSVFAIAKKVE